MSSLLLRIVVSVMAAYGAPMAAHAQENSRPISVDKIKQVGDMRVQLQDLVNGLGFHSINRFCVIGYMPYGAPKSAFVYVFWPTENEIIEWDRLYETLLEGGEPSDLTHDILPDNTITVNYLHRSDLISILDDCWKHGTNYVIKRTVGHWIAISHFQQFSSVTAQLKYLTDNNNLQKNDFCVVGQADGHFLAAYVYWKTANRLILWVPTKDDSADDPTVLSNAFVNIDLKRDLRDQEDKQKYYTLEMQKSYAEMILNACRKYGDDFVILRSN
jgi:hypothetical protein